MILEKIDKRMFEYLSHLKFGKVDHKTLSWDEYQKLPSSDWVFPENLETYFEKCFLENKDLIQGKTVLDIGCEYGNKIPWFDKFNPKKLICIDPNVNDMYIANMAATLVKTETQCITDSAENCELEADTVFMLSVNQHFKDQFLVYENIKCDNLIIDTWTDIVPIEKISKALKKKFIITNEYYLKSNRVILRCEKKKELEFKHSIPVEVLSAGCPTTLEIDINGKNVFSQLFEANSEQKIDIEFVKKYNNGEKNKITFKWNGAEEYQHKHLKINSIVINDQVVNLYNSEYFPELSQEWWDNLSAEEQEKYNQIINGNIGNVFGWYGEINFYFCTGQDLKSKHKYNKNNKDPRRLLDEQISWIYMEKQDARLYNKVNV